MLEESEQTAEGELKLKIYLHWNVRGVTFSEQEKLNNTQPNSTSVTSGQITPDTMLFYAEKFD